MSQSILFQTVRKCLKSGESVSNTEANLKGLPGPIRLHLKSELWKQCCIVGDWLYLASGRSDSKPDFGVRDTWVPALALPLTRSAILDSFPELPFL